MKYLLSTGKTTNSELIYIQDIILINMKILKKEIPYFTGGTNDLIESLDHEALTRSVDAIANDSINRVKSQFPNLIITLDSIIINKTNIKVSVNINDKIYSYELKGSN